ncbi:hypothetical protein TBR22_A19010 [Luteitalea sp. TBR-22]|nr:hypothetical protein TBR22_A19010 [Luteitalea sp. TBR-22]
MEKDFGFSTGVIMKPRKPHYAFDPHVSYADRLFDLNHWIRSNTGVMKAAAPNGVRPFPALYRLTREHVRLLRLWKKVEVARARLAATQAAVAHTGQSLPGGYAFDLARTDVMEAELRVGELRASLRHEREKEKPSSRVIARLQHRLRLARRRLEDRREELEDATWDDMMQTFASFACEGQPECKPDDPCRSCLARTRLAEREEDEGAPSLQ